MFLVFYKMSVLKKKRPEKRINIILAQTFFFFFFFFLCNECTLLQLISILYTRGKVSPENSLTMKTSMPTHRIRPINDHENSWYPPFHQSTLPPIHLSILFSLFLP